MKVLLDEDVPRKLARLLTGHQTLTVAEAGWAGIKNGELIKRIESRRYDVFITGDKNMQKQQRLTHRPFGVLVLSAVNWTVIRPHVERIAKAVSTCEPGTIQSVDCGAFLPRKLRKPDAPQP